MDLLLDIYPEKGEPIPMSEPADELPLPPKYYRDNFLFLLRFVEEKYAHLLEPAEKNFLTTFYSLPDEAQCLYVRMTNRKGQFFLVGHFQYAEITDLPQALAALDACGLTASPAPVSLWEWWELLNCFTKPALLAIVKEMGGPSTWKSLKKPDLLSQIWTHFSATELLEALNQTTLIRQQKGLAALEMIRLLFAGEVGFSMSEFVIRDLGHARFEDFGGEFAPTFQTRQEAEDKMGVSLLYQEYKWLREVLLPVEVYNWLLEQEIVHRTLSHTARPTLERLVGKMGLWLEQNGLPDEAERVYAWSASPPARERRARLLHKLGRTEEALALCEAIVLEPHNATEATFAADFAKKLTKGKTNRLSTTEWLQAAPRLVIPRPEQQRVEVAVLAHFQQQGKDGFFAENYLWRAWMGLLCWDIIFSGETQAVHHPLQRIPSDLRAASFFEKRAAALAQRMELLRHQPTMLAYVERVYAEKEGTLNNLVSWHPSTLDQIRLASPWLPPEAVGTIFMEMAKNLNDNGKGFPDLFVFGPDDYQLVEVKSPNDHLSAQQLFWLRLMEKVGIRATLLRIEWLEETET